MSNPIPTFTFDEVVETMCKFAVERKRGSRSMRVKDGVLELADVVTRTVMHVTDLLLRQGADVRVRHSKEHAHVITFRFEDKCFVMMFHIYGTKKQYSLSMQFDKCSVFPAPDNNPDVLLYCVRTQARQQRMAAFCMGAHAVRGLTSPVRVLSENALEMVYAQLLDAPVPTLDVGEGAWATLRVWTMSLMQ